MLKFSPTLGTQREYAKPIFVSVETFGIAEQILVIPCLYGLQFFNNENLSY